MDSEHSLCDKSFAMNGISKMFHCASFHNSKLTISSMLEYRPQTNTARPMRKTRKLMIAKGRFSFENHLPLQRSTNHMIGGR